MYFTDWSVFSVPLLRLISAKRLRQIKSFSAIITTLLEYRCYPAATCVAERIFSVISSNAHLVPKLNQQDIDSFIDAIISLEIFSEEVDKSSVLEKFIVPVFTFLTLEQQCQLLVDLQVDDNSRLRGSSACLELYKTLTNSLIQRNFCSHGITPDVVLKVINCHLQLNDKKIMDDFVYHILWRVDNQETGTDNVWLEKLLTAAVSSPFAKSSLLDVLTEGIDVVTKACIESPCEGNDIAIGELSRFFSVLLRIERFDVLADSNRLASLTPIYQKMNPNRLKNLIADLLKHGNPHMKKHRSTHDVIFKMGNSLLQRDCSSFKGGLPIQVLVEILCCLHRLSLVRLFIDDICGNEKWNWRGKSQLVRAVLTSTDIWSKFIENETTDGLVRNIQTDLLRSWIAGLEVATASESNAIEFRSNVSECFLFFVREEKKFYSLRTDPNSTLFPNDLFASLFEKMPVQELARLIWNVYQADVKEVPTLKKFPTVLNVYRELCEQFVNKCDVAWCRLPNNMLVETAKSLLWLKDDSFSAFGDKIMTSHPDDEPNDVILKIAKSADIRELTDSFPPAQESLCHLLELRVSAVTEVLEKIADNSWRIPNCSLPEHPNVEDFLRSSSQKMVYADFRSTEKAQQFSIFLCSFGAANGLSLEVQTKGEKYEARCKIVKLACPESNRHSMLLSSEKATLEEVIAELKVQPDLIDEDDVVYVPRPKKRKLHIECVEISD